MGVDPLGGKIGNEKPETPKKSAPAPHKM